MNVVRSALAQSINRTGPTSSSALRRMSSSEAFPITSTIRSKLTDALQPTHLDIINESHMHNVPPNSETHFKVVVVSPKFEEAELKSPLSRHRCIYSVLEEEMNGGVHALAIVARSPSQWKKSTKVDSSPSCRGGDGSLPPKNSTSSMAEF